tara:strand:+ start:608 stop:979 length:372 start_codon:yes stop_codon:yes gene_type:complete
MIDAVQALNQRISELEEENYALEQQVAELGEVLAEGILSKMVEDSREELGCRFVEQDTPLKERAKVIAAVYTITLAEEKWQAAVNDTLRKRMRRMKLHVPRHVMDLIEKAHPFPPDPFGDGEE